jgi:putative membrane protein
MSTKMPQCKKNNLLAVFFAAISLASCQESTHQENKSTVSQDTSINGLEGTRDEAASISTDVRADTSSGQLQSGDQHTAQTVGTDPASSRDRDANFLSEAAASNYGEISAADAALHQATIQEEKSIAQMLKKDHTAALQELKSLSGKKGLTIATDAPADVKASLQQLVTKQGSTFDKAWCEMMIDKHKATITKFEGVAKTTSDDDVKKWINKTLPKLRNHLDELMSLHGKIKA